MNKQEFIDGIRKATPAGLRWQAEILHYGDGWVANVYVMSIYGHGHTTTCKVVIQDDLLHFAKFSLEEAAHKLEGARVDIVGEQGRAVSDYQHSLIFAEWAEGKGLPYMAHCLISC